MKNNVEYELDFDLKEEIREIKNLISKHIINSEVYLFGSVSKGRYSKNSDIDILVLIEDEKSVKELRNIRHFLEDEIECLRLNREVDIKLYTKNRFLDISSHPSFEQAILKDLVDIRSW